MLALKETAHPFEIRLTLNALGLSTRYDAAYFFVYSFNCFSMLMKIPIRGSETQHKKCNCQYYSEWSTKTFVKIHIQILYQFVHIFMCVQYLCLKEIIINNLPGFIF